MDGDLQQPFIYNNSSIETGESFDFSTAIQQTTQSQESSHGNMTGMSNTSCNFATFDIATHTMQQQQRLQHPSYPSIRYHVTCKLISYSLVENILNNEACGMNFDTKSLSLDQNFILEDNLKQKLFYRMICDRNTNDIRNNEMITQTVSSMADNQNYNNDSDFSSNEHITHQDTNGLAQ